MRIAEALKLARIESQKITGHVSDQKTRDALSETCLVAGRFLEMDVIARALELMSNDDTISTNMLSTVDDLDSRISEIQATVKSLRSAIGPDNSQATRKNVGYGAAAALVDREFTVDEIEALMIEITVKRYSFEKTAKRLGLGVRTVYRKVETLGIDTGRQQGCLP